MEAGCLPTTPSRSTGSFLPLETSTPVVVTPEPASTSQLSVQEASDVTIDSSMEDFNEKESVERFVSMTCGCKYGPKGSPCSSSLTKATIHKCRADNLELSRDELDLVILAQIRASRSMPDSHPTLRKSHHTKTTNRSMTEYYIHGLQICRKTMFLHCLSHKRLENLIQHFDQIGLSTRTHGNMKRLPKNTLSFEDTNRLTTFVTNYARAHGLPLPGRLPGHRDKVVALPSDLTKVFVYGKYKAACDENGWLTAGRSKFYEVWQDLLPHISVSTPSTDLCFTCQQNTMSLQKSVCLPEEEKVSLLESAQKHLLQAKTEREYYNNQVEAAQTARKSPNPRIAHYSYDFAQQIHYPYDAQQTGPEYFKTARKCGLFGVCNDGKQQLVLYLIDEAVNPGKGADCVISLLHHHLDQYGQGEQCVYLHADNCVGQNKNNANIQYLLWRVLTGCEESIELSCMLVGHTKFSPDRHFGYFKKLFRHSSVSTLAEIATVVQRSTTAAQNVPQLIQDSAGTFLVNFSQWSAFLSQFFRPIPNITSYHNFKISSDQPDGTVILRSYSDSKEERINILKPGVALSSLKSQPDGTHIPGLDLTRQWYLYENIRMHCKSTLAADITCPKPSLPKPAKTSATKPPSKRPESTSAPASSEGSGASTNASDQSSLLGKRKRAPSTCSICHTPGHTKRTCPSK